MVYGPLRRLTRPPSPGTARADACGLARLDGGAGAGAFAATSNVAAFCNRMGDSPPAEKSPLWTQWSKRAACCTALQPMGDDEVGVLPMKRSRILCFR